MKAIFYDRKNNCEVSNEDLMFINLVDDLCTIEDEEPYTVEIQRGELGYKSKDCPKIQNWDRYLNYSDLVFLRFE